MYKMALQSSNVNKADQVPDSRINADTKQQQQQQQQQHQSKGNRTMISQVSLQVNIMPVGSISKIPPSITRGLAP